jgi:RNA polymerase-binding transcription factor DksA
MMRVAFVRSDSKVEGTRPSAKRQVKKTFKQMADEALEERRAFDRQKAKIQNKKEREELNRLLKQLDQLKTKKYGKNVHQS